MMDASTAVLELVSEMSPLGLREVWPDTELVAELGFDSLGLVELLVALEEVLKLPPVDLEATGKIDLVADLQRVVQEAQARMPVVRASA